MERRRNDREALQRKLVKNPSPKIPEIPPQKVAKENKSKRSNSSAFRFPISRVHTQPQPVLRKRKKERLQMTYENSRRLKYSSIGSVRSLSASDVVGQQTQASLFHALELAPECGLVVAKAREDFAS